MEIVVVGGGLAAASAVRELRDHGHQGSLTILAAEPHLPYERPPLSKAVLLGQAEPESTVVLDQQWYDDHDVELRVGTPASGLDLERRRVRTSDGDVGYDRLLLATGAQPRRLPDLDRSGLPATYLRTMDDADALRSRLRGHLLLVGAGWIGLEVASAARQAGAEVTVVDPAEQPLLGVLGPDVAARFADLHRDRGVDLRLRTTVATVDGGAVSLSDGTRLQPDLVVVGVGARPDVALAEDAGLAVGDGVLVDAALRTSDPWVHAAGDVANHDHPVLGRRIRVEHWDAAIHQGQAAARAMLGHDEPYERLPFFFTDQYDVGMEYVGNADGHDRVVVRGADLVGGCSALWARDGVVAAGMHTNDWGATDHLWRLVGSPLPERWDDPSVALADL